MTDSTFKANVVLLTVQRATSNIPVTCPEHEVPILRFLNPDADIKIEDDAHAVIELPASAEAELARLIRKYDTKELQAVRAVYHSVDHLAQHLDIPHTTDNLSLRPSQAEASLQIDKSAAKNKAAAIELKEKKKAGGRRGTGAKPE